MKNLKRSLKYFTPSVVILFLIVLLHPTVPDTQAIKENVTPVGISSFAIGVKGFPTKAYLDVQKSVRLVATNELWDFPEEPQRQQVYDTLKNLVDSGHSVQHQIHIINGPGVRLKRSELVNKIFKKRTSPDTFRAALKKNRNVRAAVKKTFVQVVEFARKLEALGIVVDICPELEDNQDSASFGVLLTILRDSGWTNADGTLRADRTIRNGSRIRSLRYEVHPKSLNDAIRNKKLRPGDYVNQDGTALSFKVDSKGRAGEGYFSPSETAKMIKASQRAGVTFFIWLEDLQGFESYRNGKRDYDGSYNDRNYRLANRTKIKSLLTTSY